MAESGVVGLKHRRDCYEIITDKYDYYRQCLVRIKAL